MSFISFLRSSAGSVAGVVFFTLEVFVLLLEELLDDFWLEDELPELFDDLLELEDLVADFVLPPDAPPASAAPPIPWRQVTNGVVLTSAISAAANATQGKRSGTPDGVLGSCSATSTPLFPCSPHPARNSAAGRVCSPYVGSL
jgi:hypothetical protein